VALGAAIVALGAIVLGFVFDERLFEPDPSKDRAYAFAGGVGGLAVLAVLAGFDGWARGSPWGRTFGIAGLLVGLLALAATALFAFGTMLVGG
jgi:hypothetical protein